MISISANANVENVHNAREAIIQDLKTITGLMEENKQKLASLNEKVNNSDIRISEFKRMVSELNSRIEERKSEIALKQDQLSTIPLSGKRATVITNHPTESYHIIGEEEKNIDSLVITNPEDFWKVSKYVVVVVD